MDMYNEEMSELIVNQIVKKMNELFITYRKRYLKQLGEDANYKFITTKRAELTNWVVTKHIKQLDTVGLKLGEQGLTKFFTFDIDIRDEADRKQVTLDLVELLNRYYGINRKDIHVWFSGEKGYHVDLYFDELIFETKLEAFYNEVLYKLGESNSRIERRPTKGLGVKLPLGIHQRTRQFCPYVDNFSLNPLPIDYFFNIEPIALEDFKEHVLDDCSEYLKSDRDKIFIKGIDIKEVRDRKLIRKQVYEVLNTGHLIESGSRNKFTYGASIVLKMQGNTEEEVFNIISAIMHNTLNNVNTKNFLDTNWTLERLAIETKRVIKNTYEKDYMLSMSAQNITFYKEELDIILSIKRRHHRQLLFSLLIQSKKYAEEDGVFYCAHSTLSAMGNDKNRGRSKKNIKVLEQMGFIEIISSRKYIGSNICAPNKYKILILPFNEKEMQKVTYVASENIDLDKVLKDIYSSESLQESKNNQDKFIYYINPNSKEHPSN